MAPKLVEWYVNNLREARPAPAGYHTVAPDSRFPNQNQTRHCYQMYLDYHRCVKKRGEKYEPCNYFQKAYKTICPEFWFEKWDEQIQNGTFPGDI
ncbi:hypothetical protein FOCC_FOCC006285 [Frankliniella occidentalis]|nr:hypothetical protein FOCC_FOCC006285 [Frankliniella occidentalis]